MTGVFLSRWTELAARLSAPSAAARRWGRRLRAAYAGPLRRYHGVAHVEFLLAEIDRRAASANDRPRLELTAFFHDFVYRTWRTDNEAASARAAAAALDEMGASAETTAHVVRLIEWTAGHAPQPDADLDDQLFLDMDLAILGASAADYDRYARGVRLEYFWVPPARYRRGRTQFLDTMLARPRVYATELYEEERAAQARANMARERARLTDG